jgi:hypothetical protein
LVVADQGGQRGGEVIAGEVDDLQAADPAGEVESDEDEAGAVLDGGRAEDMAAATGPQHG